MSEDRGCGTLWVSAAVGGWDLLVEVEQRVGFFGSLEG